jgi:tetratricopeptide (TPR) repeat protein
MNLLEVGVKEDPLCVRNAFYYARELVFCQRYPEAIEALKRYLAMPDAISDHERSYAMRFIAESYEAIGQTGVSHYWHRHSCAEAPHLRDGWTHLANFCFKHSLWAECYSAASYALSIKEKQLVYTADPKCWTSFPHDLASIAAWNLGLKAKALTHVNNALELDPKNERLKANKELMKDTV